MIPAYSSSNGSPVLRDRLQVRLSSNKKKSDVFAVLEVRPRGLSQLTAALLFTHILVQPQRGTREHGMNRSKDEIQTDFSILLDYYFFFVCGVLLGLAELKKKDVFVQPNHAWNPL